MVTLNVEQSLRLPDDGGVWTRLRGAAGMGPGLPAMTEQVYIAGSTIQVNAAEAAILLRHYPEYFSRVKEEKAHD